jgi:serine/threonine protein kinase
MQQQSGAALITLTCVISLATAASPPIITSHCDRSAFGVALRGGLDSNRNAVDRRLPKRISIQRHVSSLTVDDMYEIQDSSGIGCSAKIRWGIHRITGTIYAIKTIDLNKFQADQRELIRSEAEMMKMPDHPSQIRVHESFENLNDLHLVLELGDGGNVCYSANSSINLKLDLLEHILLKTSLLHLQTFDGRNRPAEASKT